MTVLITGGAGYIGSHAVLAFQEAGYAVSVVDDRSTGRREAAPTGVPFFEGDAGDRHFIFTSTCAVYGIAKTLPRTRRPIRSILTAARRS